MAKRMIWMIVLVVMAGTFFLSSCSNSNKNSNPAKVKEEKQTLVERQKALKEVTDFVDKANEKAKNEGGVR